MGALAHTDRGAPRRLAGTEPDRPRSTPARQRRPSARRQANWNVLTQELVPFPPVAELSVGHPGPRASRRTGPAGATRVLPRVPAPAPLTGRTAVAVQGEMARRRTAVHTSLREHLSGPCRLREIPESCLPVTRVAAPPPRRRHPRVPGGRLVRRRGTVGHEPRPADGAGCGREDLRWLPVHSSSWRHAVVDRLQAAARRRPEAACCRTRAAVARCRAGSRETGSSCPEREPGPEWAVHDMSCGDCRTPWPG